MIWLSSFVFGLVFGSFANVLIYRLKSGEPVGFARSFCPRCKIILGWRDLVPLVSFIALAGRCRHCREKISWQYPFVELFSGLIWASVFYKIFGIWNLESISVSGFQILTFFYYVFILSALLVIAVYDAKWLIIPDKILLPAIIVSIFYNFYGVFAFSDYWTYFLIPLLSAAAAFAFFFSIYFFSKGKAMGLGDAKLSVLIGLFLGSRLTLFAITAAFIAGALYGIILFAGGKKSLKSRIAFGPFAVLGVFLAFYLADFLVNFIDFTF